MAKKRKLLAIDLGYSSVKVSYYDNEGVLQFDKFISAAAKVPDPLEADNETLFKLGTSYYVLGSPALKVPRDYLMPLETFEDMKAVYPVWISYLMEYYKQKGLEFDNIVIGLSMAFVENTEELLTYLYEALLIDTPGFFLCMPQGLACRVVYSQAGLNIRETSKHNNQKLVNYLILDGGHLTCDIALVTNSTAAASSAVGIKDTGTIWISYNVMDYLYKQYEFRVSLKEAQTIVEEGGTFVRRGRTYNIADKVDEFTRQYLINILKLLEERFASSLDVSEGILVCGGLAYFFKKYINDERMIQEIEKYFPVSFLKLPEYDAEYYNSYSYLKAAEKKLENQ